MSKFNQSLKVSHFLGTLAQLKNGIVVKYGVLILIAILSLTLLHNKLQNNISKPHPDEVHTIIYAIDSMYSGEVKTLRVGESTRWLARLLHPVAIYYMNTKMGGEHNLTGWKYAGGFYLQKHLKNTRSIKKDSNIQDYFFAMRFLLGALVIMSFLIASYLMVNMFGFISGIGYLSLSLSGTLLNESLKIFYTESTLLIAFNCLIILACCRRINNLRLGVLSVFLLAFAVSTKMTGLVFLLPVAAILLGRKSYFLGGLRFEGLAVLFVVFFALINIMASSYMQLLDQTLSNVYHLKTGHLKTQPAGMYQLNKIVTTLTPWIFIFAFSIIYLTFSKTKIKFFVLMVGASAIIMLMSLIGVSYFLPRNLTTPLVMMMFVISIAIGMLMNKIEWKMVWVKVAMSIFLLILFMSFLVSHYKSIDSSFVNKVVGTCINTGFIGLEKTSDGVELENMPDKFVMRKQQKAFRDAFLDYDCIVIKNTQNNKHYTNYLLPMDYELVLRRGNYFFFKNVSRTENAKLAKLKRKI